VLRWEVLVSPDGSLWTTAVDDEPPLPVGGTHQVEIGGLAGSAAYQVEVIAVTPCGASTPAQAVVPTTPAPTSSACAPSSMTLGPATAERVTSGAAAGTLTTDVTVVVTSPGQCTGGVFVFADTGHGIVSTALTESGTYSYSGTLPGVTQAWGLGVHEVYAYSGASPAATGVLCVEEQGAGTC